MKKKKNTIKLFKNSKYNYFYRKNDKNYILQVLSRNLIQVNDTLFNLLKSKTVFNLEDFTSKKFRKIVFDKLIKKKFLIDINEDELKAYKLDNKFNLNSLHIVPTNKCNFNCKYCFVEENMNSNKKNVRTDFEKIKRCIEFFFEDNDSKDIQVTFYGGEPLLHPDFIFKCIDFIEKDLKRTVRKKLVTNASLVTRDLAKKLHRYNFGIAVSIDGKEDAHNKMRKYFSGKGTFKDTLRGYNLLKEEHNIISILCTVGNHNIKNLDEHFKFLLELEPFGIALNFPIGLCNKRNPIEVDLNNELCMKKYIKCLEISYDYRIIEKHFFDFVMSFLRGGVISKPCSACGSQIVISAEGLIGPCQAFLGFDGFFCEIPNKKDDLKKIKLFNTWKKISILNTEKCRNCVLLPVCSGGCPYDRKVRNESYFISNPQFCYRIKKMLEYLIERKISGKSLLVEKLEKP